METSPQFLGSEPFHTKSSTLSTCTPIFNVLCLFKLDPRERSGLHEVQSNEKHSFRILGLPAFLHAQFGDIKAPQDQEGHRGFYNRCRTWEAEWPIYSFDDDVEKPVESRQLSSCPEIARLERDCPRFNHQQRRAHRIQTTKLLKKATEKMTAQEAQSKDCDAQQVFLTTLRTELSMFDDFNARDLPPGSSASPDIVKDVPHDCILNYPLPAGFRNEALVQLYKTSSVFLQAAYIDHPHWAAFIFNDLEVFNVPELE